MRQKRADIDAIIAQTAPPDFTNTVLALEKAVPCCLASIACFSP
jgi:Zn-dependent oligopeptidase